MNRLSLEAQELLAAMTINSREINQLTIDNSMDGGLDPYLVLELKNKLANIYEEKHGKAKDNAVAVDNLLFWCSGKAYEMGYKAALVKYSGIIAKEIERVSNMHGESHE